MNVTISSDAEADIAEGYWFYEQQTPGLGSYFRTCIMADIDSLTFFGGVHQTEYGYCRMLAKRFPFTIYYECTDNVVTIVAVLDARRNPSWIRDRLT